MNRPIKKDVRFCGIREVHYLLRAGCPGEYFPNKETVMARKIDIKIDSEITSIIVRRIEQILPGQGDDITGYGVAKVLNVVLKANGVEPVRPQMMYNYARNGMIVRGEKIAGETLRNFTAVEVAEFVQRYILKHDLDIIFEPAKAEESDDQLALFDLNNQE